MKVSENRPASTGASSPLVTFGAMAATAAMVATAALLGACTTRAGGNAGGPPAPVDRAAPAAKSVKVSEGSLTKEEIEQVIRAGLPGIKACYEQSLKTSPDAQGRIVSLFVISAEGTVSSSTTNFTDKWTGERPEAFTSCVDEAIRGWTFPKPRGGGVVQVKYPFIFNRK